MVEIGRRKFIEGSLVAMTALTGCNSRFQLPTLTPDGSAPTAKPMKEQTRTPEQRRAELLAQHHYPVIEGKRIEAKAYLYLPTKNSDYEITEGWFYSREESSIHKAIVHAGIDIALPYQDEVVAPCDGYVTASFQSTWRVVSGKQITHTINGTERPIRFSLGYFITLYTEDTNRFLQLAHLSDIHPDIPFSQPVPSGENWVPTNHDLRPEVFKTSRFAVRVKKGDPLGKVGYSGLAWGNYEEFIQGSSRPIVVDPNIYKSWDEPHIHLEEFWRNQAGQKTAQRDIYGVYGTALDYPSPKRTGVKSRDPLVFLGENGLAKLAA